MKKLTCEESGTAVVETALTLPLLVMLLFGILQWGIIFGAYITVRNAAMVGARSAALWNSTQTAAEAKARSALAPMLNNSTTTCPTGSCLSCAPSGTDSRCTITYPLNLFASFLVPGSANRRLNIYAQSIMH